jgi:MFS family permease
MSSPPFQAVVPDLVSKPELGAAVALNSLGVNISRAIGPALGGFLLSLAGPWMVFALNALSVVGVAWVLWRWRPAPSIQRLPPEHFFSAVRSGIRYVHAARCCATCWCAPWPSSFSAARAGRCCRWWRAASWA